MLLDLILVAIRAGCEIYFWRGQRPQEGGWSANAAQSPEQWDTTALSRASAHEEQAGVHQHCPPQDEALWPMFCWWVKEHCDSQLYPTSCGFSRLLVNHMCKSLKTWIQTLKLMVFGFVYCSITALGPQKVQLYWNHWSGACLWQQRSGNMLFWNVLPRT